MNREETRKAAKVMMAFADGEDIQEGYGDNWTDCSRPLWLWNSKQYRIKPKPREIWIKDIGDGCLSSINWTRDRDSDANFVPTEGYIKFREVID